MMAGMYHILVFLGKRRLQFELGEMVMGLVVGNQLYRTEALKGL